MHCCHVITSQGKKLNSASIRGVGCGRSNPYPSLLKTNTILTFMSVTYLLFLILLPQVCIP